MANYYTQYSFAVGNITPEEEAWIKERLERDDEAGYPIYPDCAFEDGEVLRHDDSRYLWIHDDIGGSELDILAEMLQDFLAKFRPDQYIAFSWADTCSKPRIDSFGGGAVFITKDNILWMSTYDWITEQVVKMKKEAKMNTTDAIEHLSNLVDAYAAPEDTHYSEAIGTITAALDERGSLLRACVAADAYLERYRIGVQLRGGSEWLGTWKHVHAAIAKAKRGESS